MWGWEGAAVKMADTFHTGYELKLRGFVVKKPNDAKYNQGVTAKYQIELKPDSVVELVSKKEYSQEPYVNIGCLSDICRRTIDDVVRKRVSDEELIMVVGKVDVISPVLMYDNSMFLNICCQS